MNDEKKYKGYTILKKISFQYRNARKRKSIFYCVYNPDGIYEISLSDEKLKEVKSNIDNQIK